MISQSKWGAQVERPTGASWEILLVYWIQEFKMN